MTRALTAIVLLAGVATTAHAQLFAEVQAGAAWSSPLVEDSIVNAITVAPQIAPALGVVVGTRLGERYGIAGRLRWARSNLQRQELGESITVLPLGVWTGSIVLERSMWRSVSAELQFSAIKYDPGGNADGTVFQDDAPLVATLGLGVRADRPVSERLTVGVHVGYDVHQFDTQSLRSAGFTAGRFAHRVSVSVALRWRQPHASP
jgi:hypothetical protein